MTTNRAGLYIHIPFCEKKCGYCDFYSIEPSDGVLEQYTTALANEIELLFNRYPNILFNTIYMGGGTPGLLPLPLLSRITKSASKRFDGGEFTIEVNPSSANNFAEYRALGINRISIGVQSLSNKVLKVLGRQHDRATALLALERAASVFDNVSADVMLGLPYQNQSDIGETLEGLYPFANHISAYILKLVESSPMQLAADKGKMIIPDDDISADMYNYAYEHMKAKGYERYEISNFALDNKISRHNMKYWTRENYFGVGAAAHSFIDGERSENPADIRRYMAGENLGHAKTATIKIDKDEALFEEIMLRLRLKEGLNIAKLNKKYNINFLNKFEREIRAIAPLVNLEGGKMRMKEDKFLLEGAVAREFLSI